MGQGLGFDPKIESATPLDIVGRIHVDEQGRQWIYGRANGALTAGQMHHIAEDGTYDITPNTTTLTGTPGTHWKFLAVPDRDFTDNYYGWFWVGFGTFECVIENSFAAADIIYTTANAGIPGTDSSSFQIDGFKSIDAGVTSTRVTCFAAGRLTAGVCEAHD